MDSEKAVSRLLRQMRGVRKKRVKQLKARVDSGSYKVNSSKLVKALVLGQ